MSVASKLQIKPGQRVVVHDQPEGVDLGVERAADGEAVIAFVTTKTDLDGTGAEAAVEAAREDRLAWVAYPKARQLGTDLNRDVLAALMTERGVQPVRQVSLDETWSALRFRPAG